MKIRHAFLVLAATLLLPGLAMAGSTVATFEVDFEFDDNNPVSSTIARIICDTGLPLESERIVEHGDTVVFVLEFPGEVLDADCHIEVDDVAGYTPDYSIDGCDADGGSGCSSNDVGQDPAPFGCWFEANEEGDDSGCDIDMETDLVAVTVHKEWEVLGTNSDTIPPGVDIVISCDNFIENRTWQGGPGPGGSNHKKFVSIDYTKDLVAMVSPDWDGTNCWAWEKNFDSRIEVDNQCGSTGNGDIDVFPNSSLGTSDYSCTITNTLFFEGIPTLNQYGLAIMALLMLGVGFVGFRRFV